MTTKRYWLEVPKDGDGNDMAGFIDVTEVEIPGPVDPVPDPDPVDPEPLPTPIDPPPATGDRQVILAGPGVKLNEPNTIYDFEGRDAGGDLEIQASYVEVRNVTGMGIRRIGTRENTDEMFGSGFYRCEGSFFHVRQNGHDLHDPFFIWCTDVNPQPNTGDGDIMQILAYKNDIYRPLVSSFKAYGKQRPAGSSAHNDTIQIEGIVGGTVFDPTVEDCELEGASNVALLIQNFRGVATVRQNRLTKRFGGHNFGLTVISGGQLLLDGNDFVDGSGVNMKNTTLHPDSDPLP